MQTALTAKQQQQLRAFAPDHLRAIQQIQRQERRTGGRGKRAPKERPELVINLDSFMDELTAGDMEDMEAAAGVPINTFGIFGNKASPLTGMPALIWVMQRRIDPQFTYAEARALPAKTLLEAFKAMMGRKADADAPLEPDGSPSA